MAINVTPWFAKEKQMAIIPNVADFNHANSVNFTSIAAAGIWGVFMKARQGIGFGDPAYKKRYPLALQCGLLVGAYDFATGDLVATNVDDFLAFANLAPTDAACLDFEDNTQSQMTGDQAYEFLDRVNQKRGLACWIYGGNRIREQIDPQQAKWIDMAKVTPLWQCRYILSQPADNDALFKAIPPIPPWTANTFIQYTGDGVGPTPHTINGLEDGADLDVFDGSRSQLTAIWPGATITAAPVTA
jgi:GH25 family lysozyme M1 (1,4-beta-N-acetylmuramidase)